MSFSSPEKMQRLLCVLLIGFCSWCAAAIGKAQSSPSSSESRADASNVIYITSMDALDNQRPLRVGDRISMRVVEDKQLPISLVVTDSGDVDVPLLGRVKAAGKTCRRLAYELKEPFQREYYYKATVIIGLDQASLKSPGRVYVTGQVRNQGPVEIPPDEAFTVSKAILRAGGFADFADRKKVKIVRNQGSTSKILVENVDQVMKRGRTELDQVVQPGDTLIVPERLVNF